MDKIINKFRLTILITLILMAGIIVGIIHFPMRSELEKETIHNFELEARLNMQILEQYIELCLLGTRSLASRTEIRNQAAEYYEGNVTWEEMTEYIQPRYMDGLSSLRNLVGAARIIDGKEAVSFGKIELFSDDYTRIPEEDMYVLTHEKDRMTLKVMIPLFDETRFLGYDMVLFDATKILEEIGKTDYNFAIFGKSEIELLTGEDTLLGFSEGKLYHKNGNTFYIKEFVSSEQFYYIIVPDKYLYAPVEMLSLRITLVALVVILSAVLYSNWYIVGKARAVLEITEESRMKYKEYAIKDTLTGAFSRRYLEKVRQEWEAESAAGVLQASVTFIDIDDFKGLNDRYGHDVGDEALKYLVRVFNENIRSGDVLIRNGGDEFILILKDCYLYKATEIVTKVQEILREHPDFAYPVHFSYGISEITDMAHYDTMLREVDSRMYENKKAKKVSREFAVEHTEEKE